MDFFLQLLVQGIIIGCVYALAALGFVLVYKSSRVINFAHGQILAMGAFIIYGLTLLNIPFAIAAILGLAITFGLGMLIERLFLRPMVGEPIISVIMVTIGLGSLIDGIMHLTPFGAGNFSFPKLFASDSLQLGSVNVSPNQLLGVGIAVVLIVALTWFFQRSTLGIAMRAVADDQLAALSVGASVVTVFAVAWALAGLTAAAAGMTVGTISGLSLGGLAAIGIKVLPAIILGGLDSIGGAVVGGIIIGIVEAMSAGYLDQFVPGGGTNEVTPFLLLIVVLLVKPYGLFGTKEIERV